MVVGRVGLQTTQQYRSSDGKIIENSFQYYDKQVVTTMGYKKLLQPTVFRYLILLLLETNTHFNKAGL